MSEERGEKGGRGGYGFRRHKDAYGRRSKWGKRAVEGAEWRGEGGEELKRGG